MTAEEARRLASRFSGCKVLVVGDAMLDEYVWGETRRISPEAPVPIVEVVDETLRLGGAANVAHNIASLGGQVELVSLVGADSRASRLRDVLVSKGIPADGLLEDPSRPTTLKTRIVASRQQIVRVDRESTAPLEGKIRERFFEKLLAAVERADGVVVSDYGKGAIDLGLMAEITRAANAAGKFVAVDPKESHFYLYKNVSIVTPNVLEASRATRINICDIESLEDAGRRLLADLSSDGVLITRGPEGMSLFRPGHATTHVPVLSREVYDVTGAGDTVVATLTLARVAGASLEQAAVLSSVAAAIVVGEVGTAVATVEELELALEVGFPVENAS
jgi:D-beta-D-heptose 7-phosphate kinase/D-beta-D-heptose 1-phosphate adenosyltransferase